MNHLYNHKIGLLLLLSSLQSYTINSMPLDYKRTALHNSIIRMDHLHSAELLLSGRKDVDVDAQDIDGKTPIHWAVLLPYNEHALQMLCKMSKNLSLRDSSGHTALHKAVFSQNYTGMRVLVEYGLSCNTPDDDGLIPLDYAINFHTGLIRELIRLGADPNLQDANGNTPFHRLLQKGYGRYPAWTKPFLEGGARDDIPNHKGITPAMMMK